MGIHDETPYKVRHPPTLCLMHVSHFAFPLTLSLLLCMTLASPRIVHTIFPNAAVLSKHLTTFSQARSATEAILFGRTTFLVVATSAIQTTAPGTPRMT
jgi:Gtr1/RagA G protein conserved region